MRLPILSDLNLPPPTTSVVGDRDVLFHFVAFQTYASVLPLF